MCSTRLTFGETGKKKGIEVAKVPGLTAPAASSFQSLQQVDPATNSVPAVGGTNFANDRDELTTKHHRRPFRTAYDADDERPMASPEMINLKRTNAPDHSKVEFEDHRPVHSRSSDFDEFEAIGRLAQTKKFSDAPEYGLDSFEPMPN